MANPVARVERERAREKRHIGTAARLDGEPEGRRDTRGHGYSDEEPRRNGRMHAANLAHVVATEGRFCRCSPGPDPASAGRHRSHRRRAHQPHDHDRPRAGQRRHGGEPD
jgi:hypothetical protein